jgi:hypothetical protein
MGIFERTRARKNSNAATRNAKRENKKSETPEQYADANARSDTMTLSNAKYVKCRAMLFCCFKNQKEKGFEKYA